tara:strand:+ start:56 stop:523 length:468 start_codon:yes stop_codon:yes gene_type:complete
MDNKIWGPYFWFTLHTITLAYPDNPTYHDKRRYNDFFVSVQYILPCPKCREHYKQHLDNFPISISLDNKESLVIWLFNLHNQVNISLKKPIMEYEAFKEKYRKIYNPTIIEKIDTPENDFKNAKIIIFIIFITIVLGYVYYTYYKKRNVSKLFFS